MLQDDIGVATYYPKLTEPNCPPCPSARAGVGIVPCS